MAQAPSTTIPSWRAAGLRYFAHNFYLRQRFGGRVQRVSLDAGFTCPNADGTVATGGCSFCDNRSFSPSRRLPKATITAQLDRGIRGLHRRYGDCIGYVAYFQPATNTYAAVDRLRPLFEEAIAHPQVVGLAIGTRSDCVGSAVLDLLEELAGRTFLSVEYGMQTMHDRSLEWMNRGHDHASSVDAVERGRDRGFSICAHVILGLPDESLDDMVETAQEITRLGLDAVKIHNLYAVPNTRLAEEVESGDVQLMSQDEYVTALVAFLEHLSPACVIERTHGEAPPEYFLGPAWCLDKNAVRAAIDAELAQRDTWQGLTLEKRDTES